MGGKLLDPESYAKTENTMFEVTIGKSKLIPVL
jgi:hypothetical protein